jgi:cytidine deaminase
MRDIMNIEQKLFEEAKSLIEKRYPTSWGGAAAMYSKKRNIHTSVAPEIINASSALCIETGAILEAHKYEDIITHSICVVRDDENSDFKILTPCGTCQERLLFWGHNVKVGVTAEKSDLLYKTLLDLQPFHWTNAYNDIEFNT